MDLGLLQRDTIPDSETLNLFIGFTPFDADITNSAPLLCRSVS